MSMSISRTPSIAMRGPPDCDASPTHVIEDALDSRFNLRMASGVGENCSVYGSGNIPEHCSFGYDPDDDGNSSRSSSDDLDLHDDGRIVVAVGDFVADEFGAVGRSRRDLLEYQGHESQRLNNGIEHDDVRNNNGTISSKKSFSSSSSSVFDSNLHNYCSINSNTDDDDQDIVLQSALLHSMAVTKQRKQSIDPAPLKDCLPTTSPSSAKPHDQLSAEQQSKLAEESSPNLTCNLSTWDSSQLISAASATLSLCWADIDDDEGSEDDSPDDRKLAHPPDVNVPHAEESMRTPSVSRSQPHDSFGSPWTAWYDPPKGKVARLGMSKDSYEQGLFEMGVVRSPEDFWAVHGMVDWANMPVGSMLSFSRCGSKPFWEDSIHCHGGRWIVRGVSADTCESFFAKLVLLLFLGHLPDSNEFTCVTLQIKDRRRGNAIQLWTRSIDYGSYVQELHEQISYLVDDGGKQKQSKKRRGKGGNGGGGGRKALHFEFCHNSDAIERNASKLGEPGAGSTKRVKNPVVRSAISLESKCNQVAAMYSEGKSRKRKAGGRISTVGKADWSDSLSAMGCRRPAEWENETCFDSQALSEGGSYAPKANGVLAATDDCPAISKCTETSDSIQHAPGRDWRLGRTPPRSQLERRDISDEDNWRQRKPKDQFINTADLDRWSGEEPIFVEYDPQLLNLQYPVDYQNHSSDLGWATSAGGWAPLYANPSMCQSGSFDMHGCWYPSHSSTKPTMVYNSQDSQNGSIVKGLAVSNCSAAGICSTGDSTVCSMTGRARSGSFGRGESLSDQSHTDSSQYRKAFPSMDQSIHMDGERRNSEKFPWTYSDAENCPSYEVSQQFFYSGAAYGGYSPDGGCAPDGYFYPWMMNSHHYDFYVSPHSSEISKLADSVVTSTEP